MLGERQKELTELVEEKSAVLKAAEMMGRPEITKNVVIFSDSMAKYTQQYLSSQEFSYHVVAHRGAQIHDVTQNIQEFSTTQFDHSTLAGIVLHVGTNNLCNSQTLDQNIQDYKDLLHAAISQFPHAGILVSGILPRFDSTHLHDAVQMYNIILAQLCKTFAGKVQFVDLGSHFRTDRFFAVDGLHLSYQGNPRFAAKLQEAVEYHFSTDPEHIRRKEAWLTAMQNVPLPKPFLKGPPSKKVEQSSQTENKPRLPRMGISINSAKQKLKGSTLKKQKLKGSTLRKWHPKQKRRGSDLSDWNGWTRCSGPTASCSPSGNGPKWETEYLVHPHGCFYQSVPKTANTQKSCQPKCNTRKGKKRKRHGNFKVDQNPTDLDKIDELLAELINQRAPCPEARARPRKCKRKESEEFLQNGKVQVMQHVVPQPTAAREPEPDYQNAADLYDDTCWSYPVYIQMWDGQLLAADVSDDSTTRELHEAVEKFYGNGLPEVASFYRGGLKLKDDIALKHQGIVQESTVQTLLKLKGGGDRDDTEPGAEAKPVRHMTEWTEEEAQQWMQSEGKMTAEEVKPLVEEQVDGLALWEMTNLTLELLKKHFSCLSGGAIIKLRKALKCYKESWQSFEQVTRPDELPANVNCWREKDIRFWLSHVVKFTKKDIDSLCALELDGESLLMLDEETVTCFLPGFKKGPVIKLLSCIDKLSLALTKPKTGTEDIIDGKYKEAEIPSSNEETSLDEAPLNIDISDESDTVAKSPSDAPEYADKTKETDPEVLINVDDRQIDSHKIVETPKEGGKKKSAVEKSILAGVKDDDGKALSESLSSQKDVPKSNLPSSTPSSKGQEHISASLEKQVSHQKPAQMRPAQPASTPVKLTEKEEAILNLLKSSNLSLYESQLTQSPRPQECEISLMYARPKKKNELDLLLSFIVIRKTADSQSSTSSQASEFNRHLWGKIRKNLTQWIDLLPKKCRKEYHVDQTATSSENVFRTKDKSAISLSKKDPACIPLGQVDIAVLKSIKPTSTIFIIAESFMTEEPLEYVTVCGTKDRTYYFQYSQNENWHASFDEANLMKGLVMKVDATKTTTNSDTQLLDKRAETDKESQLVPSTKELSHLKGTKNDKTPDESLLKAEGVVGPSSAADTKVVVTSRSAQPHPTIGIPTVISDDQDGKKRSNMGVDRPPDTHVGDRQSSNGTANQSYRLGEEQAMGDRQRSDIAVHQIFRPEQLHEPLTTPSEQPFTTLSSSSASTSFALGPGEQRPFPFGRSDTGKVSYRRGAVLTVMESGAGSLIEPSHEFKVFQQIKSTDHNIPPDAKNYFIYETLRFVTGCINARRNGTIHFGVGDDVGGKYQHGEIVGIGLQEKLKAKFDDIIKYSVPTCFREDWSASSVNQCIHPVRFIPVQQEHLESSVRRYVIEVDVAPTYSITQNRAFFIRFPQQMKQSMLLRSKIHTGKCLFFRKRASTVWLRESDLDDFQNSLLQKLAQERIIQEKTSTAERIPKNHEYNAKKLEGCLLGGETDLRTRYPILFVSKPVLQNEHSLNELSFIAEIPWIAIFDLDPNSDGSGLCKLFRSQMKKECSLYQPEEKFFHITEHEELADAIVFPEKTCWIFTNGRCACEAVPYDAKRWNGTERCKAVKNAIWFFARQDKIPPGKAVIVFLVLSEEIEIMVNCFRYCFDDFCGLDNILCLFENENTYETWQNQVQSVCSLEDLQGKSIVGMPWTHINQTLQFINGLQAQTEPQIPTSSGSYVLLTNQYRNSLDDLEVLSKNQCEDLGVDPESDYFEELSQKQELLFYKGHEVDWLNFFFTDLYAKNHVMTRDKFSELHKLISAALFLREPLLKRKPVVVTILYYQAGSGATTLCRHVLWAFRKSNVRCCLVQRITDYTAKQVLDLRHYGEDSENDCFPVLLLIDNKNEELVQNLIADIQRQIKNRGIIAEKPVCIILQSKRTQDAKKHHHGNPTDSEYLEQCVSDKEMKWLEKKQKELEETVLEEQLDMSFSVYESDSDNEDADLPKGATEMEKSDMPTSLNLDKNPHLFIKFMILRKNFEPEFVKNVVANSLNDVKGNEILLLRYTALLNVFAEKEDSYIPLHCAEALMGIDKNRCLTMNSILSPAAKVFLILVERLSCGIVQGYKFVDTVLAKEVLIHMVEMQQNLTYSSIACDFLKSRLFSDAYHTKDLDFFTKEMLKRRKKFAYGDETETQFSLLVEHICKKEGHEAGVAVLEKGLAKFVDPMIAQTLARLVTKHNDFVQAHKYAQIALDLDYDNSYLLVTAGKVYHEEMIKEFEKLDRSLLRSSMLQNTMSLAIAAVEHYSKSQEANKRGKHALNLHCYLEDIKTHFKMLSMMNKVDPFKGSVGQAKLQRYLVDPEFVPGEVQEVWKEYHNWIKSIKAKIDISIDFLEKYLTYNKQKSRDIEDEWFKKTFYQQVRKYPEFFGMLENTVIENDEERKRLQACTLLEGHNVNFSRAFDFIRKGKNAVPNLERVLELLKGITGKTAFDLEGLISVSLALSTVDPYSKKIPLFRQVYQWCVLLTTLAPSRLEPHFFLTMFLWPREDIGIDFEAGSFELSKERLPILYKEQGRKNVFRHVQAHKRMTTNGYTRPMPATNFFLSTGKGLQSFLHISSLTESHKNFDRDHFWESEKVQSTLRRLEGMCLDTDKIRFMVKDSPSIEIRTSRPIMQKGASQDKVSFFLGFSWEGPIAYHVKVHQDW